MNRVIRYPEAARAYLREHRRILSFFTAHPNGRVRVCWNGEDLDLQGYRCAFRALMDKRINLAGGVVVREPRDEESRLRRDQRRLAEHGRVRHYGLETRLARKRFPEVDAEMREQRSEP